MRDIIICPNVTVNPHEAEIIAVLLNSTASRPGKIYTKEELLKEPEGYFLVKQNTSIIGIAKLKKVQWYQWECLYLVIQKEYRGKGFAKKLITAMENYVTNKNGGIMQATIDKHNIASQRLFSSLDWRKTIPFNHPYYHTQMEVWQKAIK